MAGKSATSKKARKKVSKVPQEGRLAPIPHWSHSSLMAFLRNSLAWYKRYVENIRDTPSNPSSVIGRAGHTALQHFYGGFEKSAAIDIGLAYLRDVPDFEINFGKAKSRKDKKRKRELMERDYLQAISFYLDNAPKHKVLGIEVVATAEVTGLPLPLKAISDLVVVSRSDSSAVDIVDHKFVDAFSKNKGNKTLFVMQAIFNYYTVLQKFGKPVKRFLVYECKKSRNIDGSPQLRRYVIEFEKCAEEFAVFHRLINDATHEITRERLYLPNPSDMFEGENSFDIYKLGLIGD